MSVLVITRVDGDVERFQRALKDRSSEFAQYGDRARAGGALHHRFGTSPDGYVVAVDEWETREQFEEFFRMPELQQFLVETGANTETPPDIMIVTAIDSPDKF
jgi:hypothetical protein